MTKRDTDAETDMTDETDSLTADRRGFMQAIGSVTAVAFTGVGDERLGAGEGPDEAGADPAGPDPDHLVGLCRDSDAYDLEDEIAAATFGGETHEPPTVDDLTPVVGPTPAAVQQDANVLEVKTAHKWDTRELDVVVDAWFLADNAGNLIITAPLEGPIALRVVDCVHVDGMRVVLE